MSEYRVVEVRNVLTHPHPHRDEITAFWLELLLTRSNPIMVGGELVVLDFSQARLVAQPGRCPFGQLSGDALREAEDQMLLQGTQVIGMGGGRWDDHSKRKRRTCTTMLVAGTMGVQQDPVFQRILQQVHEQDVHGRGYFMDMGSLVGARNAREPDPHMVYLAFKGNLDDILAEERKFVAAIEELDGAEVQTVPCRSGIRTLLVVESDNDKIPRAVRNKFRVDLLILQKADGHVLLFGKGLPRDVLKDLVRVLRIKEARAVGKRSQLPKWGLLEAEKSPLSNPRWSLHLAGGFVFNGSLTAPGVPPTRLTLSAVINIAKLALNDTYFGKKCPTVGSGKKCLRSKCALYGVGLNRCRRRRYQEAQS